MTMVAALNEEAVALWHLGDGWGWWMIVGWIWMIGFWTLLFLGITTLRRRRDACPQDWVPAAVSALDELERRYAQGELSDEQFEQLRQRLRPADDPERPRR